MIEEANGIRPCASSPPPPPPHILRNSLFQEAAFAGVRIILFQFTCKVYPIIFLHIHIEFFF
ncbi:hypothetical protein HanXRQr2_Chr04g0150261 [Helianthus annuus]|uniref:Uncharacterized protein n=1 Tax=Helianthus annuus TaxID=4232 RepID=A0A251UC40_HELAN|nr:hypothetical protein HanXRQr2_Chr04g0150261 [Helianthus annuus]